MKTETSESFLVAMKDRRDHADRAVTNGGAGETSTVLVATAYGQSQELGWKVEDTGKTKLGKLLMSSRVVVYAQTSLNESRCSLVGASCK